MQFIYLLSYLPVVWTCFKWCIPPLSGWNASLSLVKYIMLDISAVFGVCESVTNPMSDK